MSRPFPTPHGPFRADQIRSGDPYELSSGHVIHCMTTGGLGSRATLVGGAVLDSDPAVESAGVDTGYSPSDDVLRAPDVAVGNVPDSPGWVRGAPPLAVLEKRGLGLSAANRTALADCRELDVLQIWLVPAATAATPDDVFAPIT